MSDPVPPQVVRFCDIWRESFSDVLGHLGVSEPVATLDAPVMGTSIPTDDSEKCLPVHFTCGGSLEGALQWLVPQAAALQIAQTLMAESLDPSVEFSDMHRDALAEYMRQVAGPTATAWKQEVGVETEILFQPASDPAFAPTLHSQLHLSGGNFPVIHLHLFLNSVLTNSISKPTPVETPAAPVNTQPVTGIPPNLNLLLDVELDATIRFGNREMFLRDIFGLMPGAVVELNQLVSDPADLLVAGRLVARGEVVVIDGNFGLRVTEVASAGQRAEILQL